jgi:hypothetical protein
MKWYHFFTSHHHLSALAVPTAATGQCLQQVDFDPPERFIDITNTEGLMPMVS